MIIITSIAFVFLIGYVKSLNGETFLFSGVFEDNYKVMKENMEGKNFVKDDQKIYVSREFIITDDIKISGVLETTDGKKPSFQSRTLKELKEFEYKKIYIREIGGIKLNGGITIQDTEQEHIIGEVKEKDNSQVAQE